jgi:hypothetical protein
MHIMDRPNSTLSITTTNPNTHLLGQSLATTKYKFPQRTAILTFLCKGTQFTPPCSWQVWWATCPAL